MRILFLCSSLEPGRDGVGDYCQTLAERLIKIGNESAIVALNDSFISEVRNEDHASGALSVLRLPTRMDWRGRFRVTEAAIRTWQPDWVSLQFVCYGFHPKGLVLGLTRRLCRLVADWPLHIMFHELWIGESVGYGWKDRVLGCMQKRLVLEMVERLRPAVMHTSNPVYTQLLAGSGIRCGELPLFGSIPVVKWRGECWLFEEMRRRGLAVDRTHRDGFVLAGIFGTVHPQWNPRQFLDRLRTVAREMRRQPVLLAIGHIGGAGERALAGLAALYGQDLPCIALGKQPPERISEFLQALDFGIATSPWALIGKSSATAGMLDHGIPVVVSHDDWKLRSGATAEPTPHPLLFRADESFWAVLRGGVPRSAPTPRVSEVAEKMIHDLQLWKGAPRRESADGAALPLAEA